MGGENNRISSALTGHFGVQSMEGVVPRQGFVSTGAGPEPAAVPGGCEGGGPLRRAAAGRPHDHAHCR